MRHAGTLLSAPRNKYRFCSTWRSQCGASLTTLLAVAGHRVTLSSFHYGAANFYLLEEGLARFGVDGPWQESMPSSHVGHQIKHPNIVKITLSSHYDALSSVLAKRNQRYCIFFLRRNA